MGTVAIKRPFTVVLSVSQLEVEGQSESEGRTRHVLELEVAAAVAARPVRAHADFILLKECIQRVDIQKKKKNGRQARGLAQDLRALSRGMGRRPEDRGEERKGKEKKLE